MKTITLKDMKNPVNVNELSFNTLNPKMIKHALKTMQQMLQDFKSVSDHFGKFLEKYI